MTDDLESLNIGEFTIRYDSLDRIIEVSVHGQNLSQMVRPLLNRISVRKSPLHPDTNQVILPDELKDLLMRACETTFQLKKMGEHCLAAYLATRCFESITRFPNRFIENCQYALTCSFWSEILSHVWKWESENNAEIHKGHPYFFLAFAYFLRGDYDTGFVYAYNGIEDDEKLGKNCPRLHYPEARAINKTICHSLMISIKRMFDGYPKS